MHICSIKRYINAEVTMQMIHIFHTKITNVICFMIISQKVLSQHPLHLEVICLEIWKVQKISNNLVQSRTFYELCALSTNRCQTTLFKFEWKKISLVHNNSFRSFISRYDNGLHIFMLNPMLFLGIFYDNY